MKAKKIVKAELTPGLIDTDAKAPKQTDVKVITLPEAQQVIEADKRTREKDFAAYLAEGARIYRCAIDPRVVMFLDSQIREIPVGDVLKGPIKIRVKAL